MSFRIFVYYCAVAGAWAGFLGWVLGRMLAPAGGSHYVPMVLRTIVLGMCLGLCVSAGLSFLDAYFNLSLSQLGKVLVRVFAAVFLGVFGGLFGSFIAGSLFFLMEGTFIEGFAFLIGWTIVGLFIGASICSFEILTSLMTKRDFASASRKFIKCVAGGGLGGALGGSIALAFKFVAAHLTSKDVELLWSPTGYGFVAIGTSVGLLVGLAQIILKEAWIKVEAGFRPGRELLISKETTSIGRAEGSDIALFGDSGIEKSHAQIVLDGGRYFLIDQQTPGGSFINEQRINGRAPLNNGDAIRVGKSVLRFNMRSQAPG